MTNDVLTRAAATLAPSTLDRKSGTVQAIIATGADVNRGGWTERLAVTPEAVQIRDRVPLLDGHRQGSVRDILGRATDVRFEGGNLVATLTISEPATLDAIERGDISGVSIGYAVTRWADSTEGGRRVRTATSWELREVSLVPVPADSGAFIRSSIGEVELDNENTHEAEQATAETRSAQPAQQQQATASAQIRAHVGTSSDDPAVTFTRQADALAARMSGSDCSEAARLFMGFGFADHARSILLRSGVPGVNAMSREAVLHEAMSRSAPGMVGTSDFSQLLLAGTNRVLADGYKRAESPIMSLFRKRTVSDFRDVEINAIGGFGVLEEVDEHGEITATQTDAVHGSYSVKTFGKTFALTRRAIINDDLGAFGRVTAELGKAAAETEAAKAVALLTGNPSMYDGKALFHADHGNLATAGAAIGETTVSAARLAMRKQTGITGERIGVTPRYLLVGPELETAAEKFLASINATDTDNVNPFASKLSLMVEPRIEGTGWHVFASAAELPCFEIAHLASAPGPQISMREGWEVLGREFRVVLDFGVAATDWRGAYHNAGA